ncbi:3-oxoacyl-(ACP) synthase III [Bartonella bacilliformis INS]|uniref:3-oxoacyl-(Acyl-carrier-protein) synthase domain protein n=2 Tax=Bartonella bacilliformis TaxID=774 RepID=A1USH2_BARBK|nr:hypothetical protein [Bartonella bacilliformis]ABM44721.1 3-oxoacyl-(acyl-carrier-protein) synthase domain protein [Bartonella bacilliformis KC583]AMG85742.1 3-oxoacyl-ACP synthase [Bartonella bacilliformis]EKS44527.1 3-oxoacyl-(ACP) synthase III [Bartonella bacilliformis INS]
MQNQAVFITGIGLISSLGEGVDHHWNKLNDPTVTPNLDCINFSPYTVHKLTSVDWNQQIPKRSDQRQTDQTNRKKKPLKDTISKMLKMMKAQSSFAISAASGFNEITKIEQNILDDANISYRGVTTLFGYLREAQFPLALALAAIAVKKKSSFPTLSTHEKSFLKEVHEVFVTTIGIKRAEGMARLTAV